MARQLSLVTFRRDFLPIAGLNKPQFYPHPAGCENPAGELSPSRPALSHPAAELCHPRQKPGNPAAERYNPAAE